MKLLSLFTASWSLLRVAVKSYVGGGEGSNEHSLWQVPLSTVSTTGLYCIVPSKHPWALDSRAKNRGWVLTQRSHLNVYGTPPNLRIIKNGGGGGGVFKWRVGRFLGAIQYVPRFAYATYSAARVVCVGQLQKHNKVQATLVNPPVLLCSHWLVVWSVQYVKYVSVFVYSVYPCTVLEIEMP